MITKHVNTAFHDHSNFSISFLRPSRRDQFCHLHLRR